MIQPSPPSPAPLTCICCTLCSIFYIIYFIYFSSWNSSCVGPCVFFSHIKIQKVTLKRHTTAVNLLKESWNWKADFLRQTSSLANVLYNSVLLYNQMWVHRVPSSSIERVLCENGRRVQGRCTIRQVYKINPSSSRVLYKGAPMGRERKSHKKSLSFIKSFSLQVSKVT